MKQAMLIVLGLMFVNPVYAQWTTINFVDEFGEVTDTGAASESVKSIRPMSFPYHDVTARLIVNCDYAWIRFTEAPNLTDGDIGNGYTNYRISVRIGENATVRWSVRQSWGSKDLDFQDDKTAIWALSSGSTIAISMPWYGQGNVAFRWSLLGSTTAIKSSCD